MFKKCACLIGKYVLSKLCTIYEEEYTGQLATNLKHTLSLSMSVVVHYDVLFISKAVKPAPFATKKL